MYFPVQMELDKLQRAPLTLRGPTTTRELPCWFVMSACWPSFTTLKGMARWSPQQIDPGRKRYTGDAAGADESRSESAHCTGSVYRKSRHWWCNSLSPHKMAAATSETEGASAYALHLWRVSRASSYIRKLDRNCRFNTRLLALLRYRPYRFHIMWLCSGTC